mmetsp:Transcript_37598/g.115875  ORF Transcript_37598/g.115875 Transcript_37598/m.115875 type:complete len:206 (-) Transcript_37598:58-675(-)
MRPSWDCRRQWNSEKPLGARATCGRPSRARCMRFAWRHVPSTSTARSAGCGRPAPAAEGSSARASTAGAASSDGKSTRARPSAASTSRCRRSASAGTSCSSTSLPGSRCSSSFPVFEALRRSSWCIQTTKRTRPPTPFAAAWRPSSASRGQMQYEVWNMHLPHLPCCFRLAPSCCIFSTASEDERCSGGTRNRSQAVLSSTPRLR